jgi:hypothetical protein
MNWKILFLGILISSSINLFAQETKQENPNAKLYGYINWESIFDSHASITSRDGELYLYPDKPTDDSENAQLEMLSLQTRVGVKIDGGSVFGAKLSGVIETDFFATAEEYSRQIRMRHAFMKLNWEKSSLLMGHYWHPMFGPDVFPKIIQFGAGVIYNPLNRAPQIRYDYQPIEKLRITAVALEHGYHASKGPKYAHRNSAVPDLQLQITYGSKEYFLTGITAGYLMIEPRDSTSNGGINQKTVNSYNLQWFGMAKAGQLTINTKASYGTNMSQFVMLGGYARNAEDPIADPGNFTYTPYKILAVYADFGYKISENLGAGLFAGYTENMGTEDKLIPGTIQARGASIMNIYRIAPRLTYTSGRIRLALEYAYNAAAYGDGAANEYGVYNETKEAINHRIILGAKFTF